MHTLPLAVVFATRMELNAALPHVEHDCDEGEAAAARWGKLPIILLVTGIGPVNAAFALGRLLGSAGGGLRGVLNLGVAGAFSFEEHPLGEPVVIERETWPEFGLCAGGAVDPRGLGLAHGKVGIETVFNELVIESDENARAMGVSLPSEWRRVASITVAGVSGSLERAADLRRRSGAAVENMEGFALAWACRKAGIPFVECRVVSNVVGDRKTWDLRRSLDALAVAAGRLFPGTAP
jgi:futalosine hydrolase